MNSYWIIIWTLSSDVTKSINIERFEILISGLYYKSFTIVIYIYNDNGLYYKSTIIANLALARRVNYDCKARCKLKHTFSILNYNPKHLQYRGRILSCVCCEPSMNELWVT